MDYNKNLQPQLEHNIENTNDDDKAPLVQVLDLKRQKQYINIKNLKYEIEDTILNQADAVRKLRELVDNKLTLELLENSFDSGK